MTYNVNISEEAKSEFHVTDNKIDIEINGKHFISEIKTNISIGDFFINNIYGELAIFVDNVFGLCRCVMQNPYNKKYIIDSFSLKNIIPIKASKELVEHFLSTTKFSSEIYRNIYNAISKAYPELISKIQTETCFYCNKPIMDSSIFYVEEVCCCEKCFIEKYRVCDRCNDTFMLKNKSEKENLCPVCRKRNFVLPYHQFAPELDFCGNTEDNTVPYLGIELEVDDGGEKDSVVTKVMNIINPRDKMFMYCMHDGSLKNGFEMITQPATAKYHTSIKGRYEEVFNMLLEKGYLSHDTSTCGFHIHFNRDFYRDNEELYITKLLYLVDKFWDEIVRFSRRNQRRIDRYSRKVDVEPSQYIRRSNKSGNHDYHYYAVNLANKNTIEFRMFKGTLNIDTFMATIQFVNNCIICAKYKSTEEIQKMDFDELITGKDCVKYWLQRKTRVNTEE